MIAKFDSALVPYVIEQTPRGERSYDCLLYTSPSPRD